jgi:hypothetical protein
LSDEQRSLIPLAGSIGLLSREPLSSTDTSPLATLTLTPSPTATPSPATDAPGQAENSTSSLPTPAVTEISPLPTPAATTSSGTVVASSPTATAVPSPLATIELPAGCENRGRFVKDETIPDGTQLAPGELFEKVWRLQNADSCPWGPGYTIRNIDGETMGAANIVPLTITVPPEAEGEIPLVLTAPVEPGTHRSVWQLFDLNGNAFGPELYLEIEVPAVAAGEANSENLLFDFIAQADTATWQSATTEYAVLSTPLSETLSLPSPEGLVAVGQAQLRGNKVSENEALLTYPHQEDGYIEGIYQLETPLQPTDTMLAEIGFTKLSILSDDGVTFEVTFTPDDGVETVILSRTVQYRESPVIEALPLSMIEANQAGRVTLRVTGGDSLSQDWALWIKAQIIRP